MKNEKPFHDQLKSGDFIVTAEYLPKAETGGAAIEAALQALAGVPSAVNVADNPFGVVHVQPGGIGYPRPVGNRTDLPGRHPRQKPDRHPIRPLGCGSPGNQEHPLPFGLPSDVNGQPRVGERLRSRFHAVDRPREEDARPGRTPERREDKRPLSGDRRRRRQSLPETHGSGHHQADAEGRSRSGILSRPMPCSTSRNSGFGSMRPGRPA